MQFGKYSGIRATPENNIWKREQCFPECHGMTICEQIRCNVPPLLCTKVGWVHMLEVCILSRLSAGKWLRSKAGPPLRPPHYKAGSPAKPPYKAGPPAKHPQYKAGPPASPPYKAGPPARPPQCPPCPPITGPGAAHQTIHCTSLKFSTYFFNWYSRLCPSSGPTDPLPPPKVYKSPIRDFRTLLRRGE